MKPTFSRRKAASSISASRWVAYTTAGAASILGGVAASEGEIVVTNVNEIFNAPSVGGSNAAIGTFALGSSGADFQLIHARGATSGGSTFGVARVAVNSAMFKAQTFNNDAYASKLAFGANIAGGHFGPATKSYGTLAFGNGYAHSQWKTAGQGYIGFEFTDANGLELGWASITADGTAAENTFTLNSYAYTTDGEALTAGEVPEPGSLALLAVGGAGLLAWRQRRAKAAKPA